MSQLTMSKCMFDCDVVMRSWKAYSSGDGKEALFYIINVSSWKRSVIHCSRRALRIVEANTVRELKQEGEFTPNFFLKCFFYKHDKKDERLWYISECIREDVVT